jgi:hypothetical protein
MDYHLKLFDSQYGTKWMVWKKGRGGDLMGGDPGNLKDKIARRVSPDLFEVIVEVDRRIVRYDHGNGVPVYFIRLSMVRVRNHGPYEFF